jgi:hypothetical protein
MFPAAGEEAGSLALELGQGSSYERNFTEFEKLVARIYELSTLYPALDVAVASEHKIGEAELTRALKDIPKEEVFLHHYLLWAAARLRQPEEDDTKKTGPHARRNFLCNAHPIP